jgi:hypothetical protein
MHPIEKDSESIEMCKSRLKVKWKFVRGKSFEFIDKTLLPNGRTLFLCKRRGK